MFAMTGEKTDKKTFSFLSKKETREMMYFIDFVQKTKQIR